MSLNTVYLHFVTVYVDIGNITKWFYLWYNKVTHNIISECIQIEYKFNNVYDIVYNGMNEFEVLILYLRCVQFTCMHITYLEAIYYTQRNGTY